MTRFLIPLLALIITPAIAQSYNAFATIHGCRDLQDAEYLYKLVEQGDAQAVTAYMRQKGSHYPAEPQCMSRPKGTKLIVMGVTMLNGKPYECTRVEADPTCLWAPAFGLLNTLKK